MCGFSFSRSRYLYLDQMVSNIVTVYCDRVKIEGGLDDSNFIPLWMMSMTSTTAGWPAGVGDGARGVDSDALASGPSVAEKWRWTQRNTMGHALERRKERTKERREMEGGILTWRAAR